MIIHSFYVTEGISNIPPTSSCLWMENKMVGMQRKLTTKQERDKHTNRPSLWLNILSTSCKYCSFTLFHGQLLTGTNNFHQLTPGIVYLITPEAASKKQWMKTTEWLPQWPLEKIKVKANWVIFLSYMLPSAKKYMLHAPQSFYKNRPGISLVVQWLRICLVQFPLLCRSF